MTIEQGYYVQSAVTQSSTYLHAHHGVTSFVFPFQMQSEQEKHDWTEEDEENGKDNDEGCPREHGSLAVDGRGQGQQSIKWRLQVIERQRRVGFHRQGVERYFGDEHPFAGKVEIKLDEHASAMIQMDDHVASILQHKVGHVLELDRSLRPSVTIEAEPHFGTGEYLLGQWSFSGGR